MADQVDIGGLIVVPVQVPVALRIKGWQPSERDHCRTPMGELTRVGP